MGFISAQNYCLVIVLLFSSSIRTDDDFQSAVCLEDYLLQTNKITLKYVISYAACEDKDNINRQPRTGIDVEGERQKLEELSNEMCFNWNVCGGLINDTQDFFHCHSNTAPTNMHKSARINLRASSMSIELNDQYVEEEKELLRCLLAAKQSYLDDSFKAYKQHLNCLNRKK